MSSQSHPQQQEIEQAIATFLAEPSRSLEVVYVDPAKEAEAASSTPIADAVAFVHLSPEVQLPEDADLATLDLDDFLGADDVEAEPYLRVELGSKAARRELAERLGYEIKTRTAYHPAGREIEIAYAQKKFSSAQEGAVACIEWLQQASGIGDGWLWITDLEYDRWPRPLPRPTTWPPRRG